jgi:hypothetical protein
MSFKREPKMKTTEPSADEVRMKSGGHEHKKHMALGGKVAKEEREIKGIKKELKHHEHEKASKAHHGLRKGGIAKPTLGGLLGGLEATRPDAKRGSGSIEGPGYKHGGKLHKAEGGKIGRETVASEAKTKVVGAKMRKSISSKTSGVEGKGYAKGGSVKSYENTEMHGGPKMPTKKAGTGSIKQDPAGYKKGGHVTHKAEGGHMRMHELAGKFSAGHDKIDSHPMKKGGHVSHKKHGGKCNY